ncbi:MAG: Nif11 family protein [Eubacteriales bacterium]|nr:Nif11 family protein [Eubacteriales bacterium]
MKKIAMKDFAQLIEQDASLRAQLRACSDTDEAEATLRRLAGELGYELEDPRTARKLALSDDDLSAVSGGVTAALRDSAQQLNPYSWFVSLLRRLMGEDDETTSAPFDPSGLSGRGGAPGGR